MKNDILEKLQADVEIPELVEQRAEEAFAAIRMETGSQNEKTETGHGRSRSRVPGKRLWAGAAAAVLFVGTITAGAAAYMNWSSSLGEGLQVSSEMQEKLEEEHMTTTFEAQSCTDNGVTVTAEQSITDNYFTYIAFRVEGYDLPEGEQPDFESLKVTVDGKESDSAGDPQQQFLDMGYFYDGLVQESDGSLVYADGRSTETDENGNRITSYVMEDGSLAYNVILKNCNTSGFFLNKEVYVELTNLGTVAQAEFTPVLEGTWSFDLQLEGASMAQEYELSEPLGDTGATVVSAEVSPVSISVKYDFPRQEETDLYENEEGETEVFTICKEPPVRMGVRMKDGTLNPYLYAWAGGIGYGADDSDIYGFTMLLSQIVDVDQVDALLFYKTPLEEGEAPTEDDFYIVSLRE